MEHFIFLPIAICKLGMNSISWQEYSAAIRSNFGVVFWIFKWRKETELCIKLLTVVEVELILPKLLDKHVSDDMLKIPGYKFPPFRRDRVGKMGGGVVVFVKDHINCKHRPDLQIGNQNYLQSLKLNWYYRSYLISLNQRDQDSFLFLIL
jgi:hypothetical protein